MLYKDHNKTIYACDNCDGEFEPEELRIYGKEILCEKCLLARYDTVEDMIWGIDSGES